MASLVQELQREALDRNVRVSDLLRKALTVATKLEIKEFETWAHQELDGYTGSNQEVPPYRQVRGQVMVRDPYQGLVAVEFPDTGTERTMSTRGLGDKVAKIEAVVDDDDKVMSIPFPPEIANKMLTEPPPSPPTLIVHRPTLVGVLDAIRTIILNWALKLEKDGILGDGLSFDPKEKTAAAQHSHNVMNIYGAVGQSQIQQGTVESVQNLRIDAGDLANLRDLVKIIQDSTADLQLEKEELAELRAEVQTLESQLQSPKPKRIILHGALGSVQRILENAAGSAVAAPLIPIVLDLLHRIQS